MTTVSDHNDMTCPAATPEITSLVCDRNVHIVVLIVVIIISNSKSLSINIVSVSANVDLSPVTSVDLSVSLSVFMSEKCTVAKRLIGS